MSRRIVFAWIVAAAAVLLAVATAGPALAIGYYNVPGSFCQCVGYGNGAGHHACLVLGPLDCRGCCATHEVRLECPPQPPYDYYNCAMYGDGSQGTWIQESVPVQLAPQPQPTPAAVRPQVQRQPRVW